MSAEDDDAIGWFALIVILLMLVGIVQEKKARADAAQF